MTGRDHRENRAANTIWKQWLKEYEQPDLDPAIEEALVDYVEQRKRELKS
ncbi:MAG: trimethylamine methyltransferase family protein [Gammaproteobacteria bacterium]|jgi:trimethylamine--corrinoid protein Co-methyltransferase|nr:trimethylamine methyltransferase family protein [Gammaproteobacteria bacterium]MDH3821262.1 trimethylamine methyltransferase family protein [Gammaproteobacteria bacterium]MDH3983883.1 trimethylamine methyltransferase family protein [Gammaproteobacteria bacterium]